jgi:hypothetical protein
LEKHPDKTFVGRVDKSFNFLGYHFAREGLSVAEVTVEKFVERAIRLYEQERGESSDSSALREYVQRWLRWARARLGDDGGNWESAGIIPDSNAAALAMAPVGDRPLRVPLID